MTEFKINFELNEKSKKALNFMISDLLGCIELSEDPVHYSNSVLYYGEYIKLLEGLLKIFPAETTHVLEYWFDNALYSDFKKPPVKIPFNEYVMDEDMKMYTSYGIDKIKSFGSYIDEEYFNLHGNPPIGAYGDILAKYIES